MVSPDILASLTNLDIGLFGFCGVLLGLFWGFTQFITRGEAMTDLDRRGFLEDSSRITKRLVSSILIYISGTIIFSFDLYVPGTPIVALDSISARAFLFLEGLFLLGVGLTITFTVFPLIIRSIDYLSKGSRGQRH